LLFAAILSTDEKLSNFSSSSSSSSSSDDDDDDIGLGYHL
jgi:hypothetical protein